MNSPDMFEEEWIESNFKLYDPHQEELIEPSSGGRGRPMSEPSEITDIISTGRKRAAMMYPIFKDMVCEWAHLKKAGGGVVPIIGCSGSVIQPTKGPDKGDRHHGPDKNVINNGPSNVHRICSKCHNRWHALNNKYYGPRPPADESFIPLAEHVWEEHDPRLKATEAEMEENESWWANKHKLLVGVDTE